MIASSLIGEANTFFLLTQPKRTFQNLRRLLLRHYTRNILQLFLASKRAHRDGGKIYFYWFLSSEMTSTTTHNLHVEVNPTHRSRYRRQNANSKKRKWKFAVKDEKKRRKKCCCCFCCCVAGIICLYRYAHDIFDRSNERDLFATTSHYTAQCKLINKMYIIHTRGSLNIFFFVPLAQCDI